MSRARRLAIPIPSRSDIVVLFPRELLARLAPEARDTLLAPELAHYCRCDHWVRVLEFIATGLYSWHRAVWLTRAGIEAAEEECYDAWVVGGLAASPRRYAVALLALVLNTDLKLADHDIDQDGKPTLFELYVLVAKAVARSYVSAEELSTEHAQLEDDGYGVGHEVQNIDFPPDLGGPALDRKKPRTPPKYGLLAARILLLPSTAVP